MGSYKPIRAKAVTEKLEALCKMINEPVSIEQAKEHGKLYFYAIDIHAGGIVICKININININDQSESRAFGLSGRMTAKEAYNALHIITEYHYYLRERLGSDFRL